MIKVTIGNNVKRKTEIVDPDTTLRDALETSRLCLTSEHGLSMRNIMLQIGMIQSRFRTS